MPNYNVYPVKQLKTILKSEITKISPLPKVTGGISKLRKNEVITLLNKYNISYYPPIEKQQYNKKLNIKTYNDDEQEHFLNKGYEEINPLKSKGEYLNLKTNEKEIVQLLSHQENFLKKFFLSNVSGSIVFHGVGTGKSLTAAAASHYYLSLNPEGHIVFVSPPALILNFINALKQYGLDEKDNRYSFYSFEKFSRNSYIKNKKTLFIVDEAHILRTKISVYEAHDENQEKIRKVESNIRGDAVLEAIKLIDKCILLTGTPFINKLYDIENLLSMVEKKDPLDENNFSQMITNTESRHDYFRYKISHYENPVGSVFFPKKIQEYIPLVMDEAELKRYNKFAEGDTTVLQDKDIENIIMDPSGPDGFTSFYNGTRQYSNLIDYKKINFIIKRIQKKETTGKFIIYTTFLNNGVSTIKKHLTMNNFTYATISGKENSQNKEDSKNKYNKGEVDVLIITKAGTEGIDTIGTEAIFIYEGATWNEALVEQAIARAIRFKSHFHLPKEHQIVYVYRLLVIKPTDVETINKVNNGTIYNFAAVLKQYDNLNKQIKNLKKDQQIADEKHDFDKKVFRTLSPEEKEKYAQKVKYERYGTDRAINELFNKTPAVEARLVIMSLAKKAQILEFINELDTNIQQLEDFITPYEKDIDKFNLNKMSQKEILKLQKKYIENQKTNIFKLIKSEKLQTLIDKFELKNIMMSKKKDIAKRYQAYYTPNNIIKEMLEYSMKLKKFDEIEILEPTAGIGNIPMYILENYKKENFKINMVEIQKQNRDVLKSLCDKAPNILKLYEVGDFLQFINPIEYDLILMNPPFHLRKTDFSYLDRDYFDMDFVKKSFYMLKDKGELIALVSRVSKPEWIKWIKDNGGDINNLDVKNWEDNSKKTKEEKKATTIAKISLSIIVMYRDKKINDNKKANILLDPDLSDKQEKKAIEMKDNFGPITDKKSNFKKLEFNNPKQQIITETLNTTDRFIYDKKLGHHIDNPNFTGPKYRRAK